jgi:hypothetical protein
MNNKKIITIIILAITIILALVAIFTAVKLYQIGKKPVTSPKPSKTEEAPEVFQQEQLPCQLTFNVPGPSASPSPGQCTVQGEFEATELGNGTRVRVHAPIGYADVELRITKVDGDISCYRDPAVSDTYDWLWTIDDIPYAEIGTLDFYVGVDPDNLCTDGEHCGTETITPVSPSPSLSPSPSPEESPSPSPSAEESPGPSPSDRTITLPSPSPSALPGCWDTCTSDSQCSSSLRCIQTGGTMRCANPYCPDESDCICPVSQASLAPKAPAEELPTAGTSLPTFILGIGGILLVIVGLIL